MTYPKKSLWQHWLTDETTLRSICDSADLSKADTVLEIGPGLGNLTRHLIPKVKKVIAVEKDEKLAKNLPHHISQLSEERPLKAGLEEVEGDILEFDLTKLPKDYKVVANTPYYPFQPSFQRTFLRKLGNM